MDLTPKELYSDGKPIVIKGLLPTQSQVNTAMKYLYEQGYINNDVNAVDYMQCFEDFVVIGDSVSCGYTNTADGNVIINSETAKKRGINYPAFLSHDTGRKFTNLAVGGTTTTDWRTTHITTAENVDTDCYIVMLGINDMISSKTLGDVSDIASEPQDNNDTFYGNLDYVVRTLLSYKPTAKLFLLTIPLNIVNKDTYNAAIRYVGTHTNGVHLIDIDAIYADEFATGFMSANQRGVHLTTLGYRRLASMIHDSINSYIREHFNWFDFIPYESD